MPLSSVHVGGYQSFCCIGSGIGTDFKSMLDQQDYTDCVLNCNGTKLKVHKCILACRSEKLHNMILKLQPNDDLVLDSVPGQLAYPFMQFVYSNSATSIPLDMNDTFAKLCEEFGFKVNVVYGCATADSKQFMDQIKTLVNNPDCFPDIKFDLEDQSTIVGHRCILSNRVEYFKAMFGRTFVEASQDSIKFNDCASDAFLQLLQFIYVGDVKEIVPESSVALLEIGVRLNYLQIKSSVEHVIVHHLELENVLQMLNVSEYCESQTIRRACVHMIASHYESFAESKEFAELEDDQKDEIKATHEQIQYNKKNKQKLEDEEMEMIRIEEEFSRQRASKYKLNTVQEEDGATVTKVLKNKCIVM